MDIENDFFYNLNPVAAAIWDILREPASINDICEQISEMFNDVPHQNVEKDVVETVDTLISHGLIDEVN